MSYIDREAFITEQCHQCDGWCDDCSCDCLNCKSDNRCDMMQNLADFPAADVKPVVRGKWIDSKGNPAKWDDANNSPIDAYCSVCGEWLTASDEYPAIGNYCPNCGAKMESEK